MKNKILVNTSFAADKWGMVPRLLLEPKVPLLFCPPTLLLSSLPCPQFILHPCSTLLFGKYFLENSSLVLLQCVRVWRNPASCLLYRYSSGRL